MLWMTNSETAGDRYVGRILAVILAVLAGIFFMYSNLSNSYNFYRDTRYYEETTAVITGMTRRGGRGIPLLGIFSPTSHLVSVRYEVGGNTYTSILGYSSRSMRPGGKIKVYYDPNEPYDNIYGEGHGMAHLFCAMLTIIIYVGGWRLYRWYYHG